MLRSPTTLHGILKHIDQTIKKALKRRDRVAWCKVRGLATENNFFNLKSKKGLKSVIIFLLAQEVRAGAQKSGEAAALHIPAAPPPPSLKRMYFLIQLKRANVARHELIRFYSSCIRSVLTCASLFLPSRLLHLVPSRQLEILQVLNECIDLAEVI